MNQHLMEQMASQHEAEQRDLHADRARARQARQAQRAGRARAQQARRAAAPQAHGHVIRRRAGWALVSLGLRLAYAAGED